MDATDLQTIAWCELEPAAPNYYFVPQDVELAEEYERGWKITEAMPVNSVGIATARDALTVHFSPDDVWRTVVDFSSLSEQEARSKYELGPDARDWKVGLAQKDLLDSGPQRERVVPVYYRPFDVRYSYYTGRSRGFHCMPRAGVMNHFFGHDNLGLVTSRLTKGEEFAHAQIIRCIAEVICMSPKTSNNGFVFPLWLYGDGSRPDLLAQAGDRVPNLAHEFVAAFARVIGRLPEPEEVLAWIFAILYAPSYRSRYADFLKRDFPRVPLPPSRDYFDVLVAIGGELIALHTMDTMLPRITRFDVAGSNEVVKPRWASDSEGDTGRVYINDAQYFGQVPAAVWDMHIGGYRVAEKWLKDRKGRQLSYDDLTHYQSVIATLARTLELQAELDRLIEEAGGWPLQ